MIGRREALTLLGGAAAWPLAATAQQGGRIRRIGIMMPYPPSNMEMQSRVRVFRAELQNRGWTTGSNIQFDERWTTDSMELIRSAAANLVELQPDALLTIGGRVISVLQQMTRTVPIVVPGGIDPVAAGWIESLSRPGRNITGFTHMELSIFGKMLQTLREIAPKISAAVMIYNPDNPEATLFARSFEGAARSLGIEAVVSHVHGPSDIERSVASAAVKPNNAVFFPSDLTVQRHKGEVLAVVAHHRLPAIYSEREFVTSGGLAFYGVNRSELYRSAATYVDRILRGEKASELPYQQPTKYDLVINRKCANALGLEIPPKLLFTADEVIE